MKFDLLLFCVFIKIFFQFFASKSFVLGIQCLLVLQDFIYRPLKLYDFCRNTTNNCIRRHIFSNYCSRSNSTSSSNRYARQKSYITTNPHIPLNNYIVVITIRFIHLCYISNKLSKDMNVIPSMNSKTFCNCTIAIYNTLCIQRRNMSIWSYSTIVANKDISWIHKRLGGGKYYIISDISKRLSTTSKICFIQEIGTPDKSIFFYSIFNRHINKIFNLSRIGTKFRLI